MLCVVRRSFTVAPVMLEELKAAAPVEGMLLGLEDAKAPWNMEVPSTVAALSSNKSMSREALLQLLNACGVSSAAQRLALDILMKLVRREGGKFDEILFSEVLCSLVENKGFLLEYFMNKYFDTRDQACTILKQTCTKPKKCSSDMDAIVLKTAFEEVFTSTTEKGALLERDKQLLLAHAVLPNSEWRNCDTLLFPVSECADQSSEEEDGCCKANALGDLIGLFPEEEVITEDLSSMIQSAARVRDTDTNSKAGAGRKKPEEDDENDPEDEEDQENDQGGGESGGDEEGESDEPDQGGKEEDEGEEDEEEEEEVNEEEEEEDDDQAQPQPQQQQQQHQLNLNNINNNGGEYEDEEENDGGVEQDDEEGDGDGGEDEDEEDEEDQEAAPPKKKQKK